MSDHAMQRWVGRSLVLVHAFSTLSDEEWSRHIAQSNALPSGDLVIWADGSLSARQREMTRQNEARFPDKARRVVMFTDSRLTRGVLTALSWVGVNSVAYAKKDFARGMADEGYSVEETEAVATAIREMEAQLKAGAGGDTALAPERRRG